MNAPLLLDTCAVIWIAQGEPLSDVSLKALESAEALEEPVFISPITAWEIGLLVSRGRLNTLMSPAKWFDQALRAPSVRLSEMSSDVLIASSFLPGTPPNDPADRIIVSTAREYGYRVMTRDRRLLDYGKQGHVPTLAC